LVWSLWLAALSHGDANPSCWFPTRRFHEVSGCSGHSARASKVLEVNGPRQIANDTEVSGFCCTKWTTRRMFSAPLFSRLCGSVLARPGTPVDTGSIGGGVPLDVESPCAPRDVLLRYAGSTCALPRDVRAPTGATRGMDAHRRRGWPKRVPKARC
jgi:hypothetical protein